MDIDGSYIPALSSSAADCGPMTRDLWGTTATATATRGPSARGARVATTPAEIRGTDRTVLVRTDRAWQEHERHALQPYRAMRYEPTLGAAALGPVPLPTEGDPQALSMRTFFKGCEVDVERARGDYKLYYDTAFVPVLASARHEQALRAAAGRSGMARRRLQVFLGAEHNQSAGQDDAVGDHAWSYRGDATEWVLYSKDSGNGHEVPLPVLWYTMCRWTQHLVEQQPAFLELAELQARGAELVFYSPDTGSTPDASLCPDRVPHSDGVLAAMLCTPKPGFYPWNVYVSNDANKSAVRPYVPETFLARSSCEWGRAEVVWRARVRPGEDAK